MHDLKVYQHISELNDHLASHVIEPSDHTLVLELLQDECLSVDVGDLRLAHFGVFLGRRQRNLPRAELFTIFPNRGVCQWFWELGTTYYTINA